MENSDPATIGGEFKLLRDPEDLVTTNDENQVIALRLSDTFPIGEVAQENAEQPLITYNADRRFLSQLANRCNDNSLADVSIFVCHCILLTSLATFRTN